MARDTGDSHFWFLAVRESGTAFQVTLNQSTIPFLLPLPRPLPALTHRSIHFLVFLSFAVAHCSRSLTGLSNLFLLTMLIPSLLALFAAVTPVFGGLTGSFQTAGDTQVSAMMVRKRA